MKRSIIVVLSILLWVGCGPTMTSEWKKEGYDSQPFKKIAVIAISKNLEVRQSVENNIISDLKNQKMIQTVSGLNLFPPNVSKEAWSEENIAQLLESNQIDAVLTVTPVNSYVSSNYNTGNMYAMPVYGRVGRHVYRTYDMVYGPGYYEQSQNYVIEANLYDLTQGNSKQEVMVWKGQSTVYDPSSISSGASSFSNNLVNYLVKNNIIK